MFEHLEIQHFRSIERADIALGRINIFVGANGSGKTNIIDALRFLKDAANNGLDRAVSDRHGIVSIRQWSPTKPYRIHLRLDFEETNAKGSYAVAIDSRAGQFSVVSEEMSLDMYRVIVFRPNPELYGEDSAADDRETWYRRHSLKRNKSGDCDIEILEKTLPGKAASKKPFDEVFVDPTIKPKNEKIRIEQQDELVLNAINVFHSDLLFITRGILTNFQAYSIYPNTLRLPQEPSNETYLSPEGRNLASVFKRMRKTKAGVEAINQITDAMRSIMPTLDRISVLNVGGYLVPQFHMVEANKTGHIFNVSQMSDGTLRILGLLTALYQQPQPAVIALEEPEQTINPGILTVLADAIKEVSKQTQVLVTTHSPNLLDHFDAEDIRAVDLVDGKTRVGPISPVQVEVVRERLFSLGELLVADGLHQ